MLSVLGYLTAESLLVLQMQMFASDKNLQDLGLILIAIKWAFVLAQTKKVKETQCHFNFLWEYITHNS